MPDQGGGNKPEPKEHVKQHLKKNQVPLDQVPGAVITKLNEFSDKELDHMDELGQVIEDANLAPNLRFSAMH